MDLAAAGFLGYRYLDRKIPDELFVEKGSGTDVSRLISHPLVTFPEAVTVSGDGGYLLPCRILGMIPFKDVKVMPTDGKTVLVSGSTVGLYMETEGVLVVDTGEILTKNGETKDPAKNILKPGDYIISMNKERITSKRELMEDLDALEEERVILEVVRDGAAIPVSLTPVRDAKGDYKLGIWVRDDTQGIGTLTYVDEQGRFGALGHGISDVDTGGLLKIRDGALYKARVLGIQKGAKGSPGELSGLIRYEKKNVIGTIEKNTGNGIYGDYQGLMEGDVSLCPMKVGYKQEMETGPASILCCVENQVQEYQAEITKIDMNHEDNNKSFVIKVTDENLLSATGGIVQGMSGSPVLQKGKIVGAVTHVFVQDAASGYGIFIENMLKEG
ncbi:MAG: SpoIVB peptidase [Eubacteriales bacterium]|nr:SpoIVB peptidase [Eubacteriales bacterium]